MLLPIFEPKNCSEETTRPNWMKLGMVNLYGNTNNIIEAIFDFPPLSRDMRPLRGTPREPRGPKIFFLDFFIFFCIVWWIDVLIIWKSQNKLFFDLVWVYHGACKCTCILSGTDRRFTFVPFRFQPLIGTRPLSLFARTAHSFAHTTRSFTRSAILPLAHSSARSLAHSLPRSWEYVIWCPNFSLLHYPNSNTRLC